MKGPSANLELKCLDLVWCIAPPPITCTVYYSVWPNAQVNSMSLVGEIYYIGTKVNIVKKSLCAVRLPALFTRLPCSLSEISFWKSSEWKNCVLYFMLPTRNGALPTAFFMHASLLAEGLFLLLGTTVIEADIQTAEPIFKTFACDTGRLCGEGAVQFDVHKLLHLAKGVCMLEPLWVISMFSFEGGNGKVPGLVSAAKGVLLQIAGRLVMNDTMREVARAAPLSVHLQVCAQNLQNITEQSVGRCGLGAAK